MGNEYRLDEYPHPPHALSISGPSWRLSPLGTERTSEHEDEGGGGGIVG